MYKKKKPTKNAALSGFHSHTKSDYYTFPTKQEQIKLRLK